MTRGGSRRVRSHTSWIASVRSRLGWACRSTRRWASRCEVCSLGSSLAASGLGGRANEQGLWEDSETEEKREEIVAHFTLRDVAVAFDGARHLDRRWRPVKDDGNIGRDQHVVADLGRLHKLDVHLNSASFVHTHNQTDLVEDSESTLVRKVVSRPSATTGGAIKAAGVGSPHEQVGLH